MDTATAARLNRINREFYERVAPEFSRSRRYVDEGIRRGLEGAGPCLRLLDLGCGDGRVGRAWREGALPLVWTASSRYVGLDRSTALLAAAGAWPEGLEAVEVDIETGPWPPGPFDVICCLAVLHHLPGRQTRIGLLRRMAGHLAPRGRWLVSVWQFLHEERFRRRLVDWGEVGIDPERLDPGDFLLDWRRGPRALRYVHHYDGAEELVADCLEAGLVPLRHYRSDGRSGDLGLYVLGEGAVS